MTASFESQLNCNGVDFEKKQWSKLLVTNNLAHTIIKQVAMSLNGTSISPHTDTYIWYFETLLNYNRDDGEIILKPQGRFSVLEHAAE